MMKISQCSRLDCSGDPIKFYVNKSSFHKQIIYVYLVSYKLLKLLDRIID